MTLDLHVNGEDQFGAWRRDADDLHRSAKRERLSNDRGIAAERSLPEIVADDADRWEPRRWRRLRVRLRARCDLDDRIGCTVVVRKVAAEDDGHLEQLED